MINLFLTYLLILIDLLDQAKLYLICRRNEVITEPVWIGTLKKFKYVHEDTCHCRIEKQPGR